MVKINYLLDDFKEKYSHLEIKNEILDITNCFKNKKGEFKSPKSYGDLEKNRVMLYAVLGAPFLSKYEQDEQGKLVQENRKYKIRDFDDIIKVISCLCLKPLRNTSMHEIKDAMLSTESIQGYRDWNMRNIEKFLQEKYSDFNPDKDSAFIMAGEETHVRTALELNYTWLSQFIILGSESLSEMTQKEFELMEKVFSKKVLQGEKQAILENSYMYGRPLYTEESTEFLERKTYAFRRF